MNNQSTKSLLQEAKSYKACLIALIDLDEQDNEQFGRAWNALDKVESYLYSKNILIFGKSINELNKMIQRCEIENKTSHIVNKRINFKRA